MAIMTLWATCWSCGNLFGCNPDLVPSIRVNAQGQPDPHGTREPVCASCVVQANQHRAAHGLPLIAILLGAYEGQECP